jgi:putative mRNA 3-end processing factor
VRVEVTADGLLLPGPGIHIDPARPVPVAIVSHGHSDHARALSGVMHATPETIAVARARLGETEYVGHAYGETFGVHLSGHDPCRVTLLPAGHVLGSAMALVESREGTLLYTGDVKLRPSSTCPPVEVPRAETLVIEATFGLPVFRFPEPEELRRMLVAEARETLAAGETPVLLAYAFGKGPEVAKILGDAGIPVALHGAVFKMAEIYRAFGVELPGAVPYEKGAVAGKALVVPPSFRAHPMVTSIKARRLILVSGWALLDASYDRFGADRLIPLSDHADWDELLRIVEVSGARRVLTTHGFAPTLARVLELSGLDAAPLPLFEGEGEDEG